MNSIRGGTGRLRAFPLSEDHLDQKVYIARPPVDASLFVPLNASLISSWEQRNHDAYRWHAHNGGCGFRYVPKADLLGIVCVKIRLLNFAELRDDREPSGKRGVPAVLHPLKDHFGAQQGNCALGKVAKGPMAARDRLSD